MVKAQHKVGTGSTDNRKEKKTLWRGKSVWFWEENLEMSWDTRNKPEHQNGLFQRTGVGHCTGIWKGREDTWYKNSSRREGCDHAAEQGGWAGSWAPQLAKVQAPGGPADDILVMPSNDPEADSQKNGISNINDDLGKGVILFWLLWNIP